ncbi:MAG: sigma-70 family RNA polymerase sigma factor [Crocinitomicaceae bacterium]|nr:sigma-70 family RNA polymerase sigma factor [Crocinitomicaceae bacterium]
MMASTNYKEFTEEEIVKRVLGGEKALYEIIVRRYNAYLYKVGRSYNYNHDDTMDLMQDTFVDAYKSLSNFQGRSTFKTWIIRIMLNNCYHRKEKSSFKNELALDIHENATPMYSHKTHETERIVHNHELGNIIENALSNIPEDYRMVFSLREVNGFNVAETAELLGISEPNVKVRLNRAKTMLREQLEKNYTAKELYDFNLIYCNAITENVMRRINDL